MDKVIKYTDQHKGVTFEINERDPSDYHIEIGHSKVWTHYIYLRIDKQIPDKELADKFWLPPKIERKRVYYDYYNSIISKLEFHGGCTWYSKESSPDALERVIKIGCDYQHLWDEGKDYTFGYVRSECINTVESLLKLTPIKIWCSWCGEYDLEEDFQDNHCSHCDGGKSLRDKR